CCSPQPAVYGAQVQPRGPTSPPHTEAVPVEIKDSEAKSSESFIAFWGRLSRYSTLQYCVNPFDRLPVRIAVLNPGHHGHGKHHEDRKAVHSYPEAAEPPGYLGLTPDSKQQDHHEKADQVVNQPQLIGMLGDCRAAFEEVSIGE